MDKEKTNLSCIKIVMYHYVRDLQGSRYPNIKGLDYNLFIKQIKWLSNNYTVITMEEVLEAYHNKNLKLPKNSVLLTFDDGYIDHFLYVLPILSSYKIQGSFFIPGKTFTEKVLLDVNKLHFILASGKSNHILEDLNIHMSNYRNAGILTESNKELYETYAEANRFDTKEVIFIKRMLQTVLPEHIRNEISTQLFEKYVGLSEEKFAKELYMNREQIKFMKDSGMYIGLHGYDHYWLENLSVQDMQKDIDSSLEVMSDFIDKEAWVLNYPYGSSNQAVREYIASKGCKLAMNTEVRIADIKKDNPYLIPRIDTNDFPPISRKFENI